MKIIPHGSPVETVHDGVNIPVQAAHAFEESEPGIEFGRNQPPIAVVVGRARKSVVVGEIGPSGAVVGFEQPETEILVEIAAGDSRSRG